MKIAKNILGPKKIRALLDNGNWTFCRKFLAPFYVITYVLYVYVFGLEK